jgi:hypothetical protein
MTDRAALVEKMRTVFVTSEGDDWHCMGLALDLALEEAAMAANEAWLDGVPVAEIPAAIRALKEK